MPALSINVQEITQGTPITDYKYIINFDNTGNPFDQDSSNWPSLRPSASHSPVVAVGDSSTSVISIPEGKYLVTVRAPGYKLGGTHVTVNTEDTTAVVKLNVHPLPLSKIRVHVFHDNHPVNGEDDIPVESGLEGFHVIIQDAVGEVTVDYFGNPLGTQYEKDSSGNLIFNTNGNPIPIPGTGGKILTDANGDALIENIPPGKYGVQATPPDGFGWIQTSTIEGTHVMDVWIEEGNDGYAYEEGFKTPVAWFGFVKPMDWGEVKVPGTGIIKGTIRNIVDFAPPQNPLSLGETVNRPWIALNDIGGNDQQVFTGRGNKDGTFEIKNVPDGLYQMVIWDEPLDYIMSFRTVQVTNGSTVDMGDIAIPRWFGWIKGTVFRDLNGNGIQDPGEEGIPNVEMGTRFKDGSVQYGTVTDMMGNYSFNEVFPLAHFTLAELGYTRFGYTSATATPDDGADPPRQTTTYNRTLTLAALTLAGATNKIDWGMKEYPLTLPDSTIITNGGISGIIYYATMRNEINPAMAMAEDYEPGIPNVTVNLYKLNPDDSLTLVNTTISDAWEHPTNCVLPDGTPDPGCLEASSNWNQIKPGVFDGGYAFEEVWILDSNGNPIPDPSDPEEFLKQPIPEGTYVVEAVIPQGYKILDEYSVNTDQGDAYTALSVVQTQQTTNMAQNNMYASKMGFPPYYKNSRTMKVVELGYGMNAACNFFMYTDVPLPGRIVGLVTDDLNVETDPNAIFFGEKRGIPYLPVGIRDYNGKLITTVYTDKNGIFEVLLSSTYTTNVPTPSGVAPGMYQVVGNDPGDPGNPNVGYDVNYQTLKLVFEVWPGKTTYADVAIFPITAFVDLPGVGFTQPPQCLISPGTPQIHRLDKVYVSTTSNNRDITIYGQNFGEPAGSVTLDGTNIPIISWSDVQIVVRIPSFFRGGPHQLLVTNADGKVSPLGITFHVLNFSYFPNIYNVLPGQSIQAAIDNAPSNSLIVVHPGIYYENLIVYKNIKLQGMGAQDTIIDGRFFMANREDWLSKLAGINFDGPQEISQGQVITVVAKTNTFNQNFNPQIDGFTITGARGQAAGGIFINAHGKYLEISNNVIQNNGGGFGGAVTIGRAYAGDNQNTGIRIHHNRILHNGGVSLAGAIGIFNGANNYEISYNEICGNYSAEYGGGISHFGYSPGGKIHHNRIQFNASFDEGAGILVGGEQPVPPAILSEGSGEVDIYNNVISGNVANDDGGGIRLLKAGTFRIRIFNNFIVNNVSTDLGGGIALDDSSNVIIYNNNIAQNASTATAEDSDGNPHGAGLVSEGNSTAFQQSLPSGSKDFSDAVLFNNIFWDNRAYHFDLATGALAPDYKVMDIEVFGAPSGGTLTPYYCYLSTPYGNGRRNIVFDGTNPPGFIEEYVTQIKAIALNRQPGFITVRIVIDPNMRGDYHISENSPVVDQGVGAIRINRRTYTAPTFDIDNDLRMRSSVDIGADEIPMNSSFGSYQYRLELLRSLLRSLQ